MGIRKHFEQQKPEDQDLKLQDLSLDIQESEKPKFDPEDFISPVELEEIINRIKQRPKSYELNAKDFAIVFPDEIEKLELSHGDLEKAKQELSQLRADGEWREVLIKAEFIKTFFPNTFNKINFSEEEWSAIQDYLSQRISEFKASLIFIGTNFIRFKILALKRFEKMEELEQLKSKLDDGIIKYIENIEDAWSFSVELANYRLLFPKLFSQLTIDDRIIRKIENAINASKRDFGPLTAILYLRSLAIITADKIELTGQGINISSFKKDFKQTRKPRPERKQF